LLKQAPELAERLRRGGPLRSRRRGRGL
jgi:hypothetical protein